MPTTNTYDVNKEIVSFFNEIGNNKLRGGNLLKEHKEDL